MQRKRSRWLWRRPWVKVGIDPARVLPAGLLLVLSAQVFRWWALRPSWFHLDDYVLLDEVRRTGPGWTRLGALHDGQPAPGVRLLASLVASREGPDWSVALALTIALSTASALACLWMLLTFFGRRAAVVVLLALALTTALAAPALMWWSTSIALLPVQTAACLALASWTRYLRGRRLRWLLGTVAAVVTGLCFHVLGLLVLPVLAYVTAAHFAHGPAIVRVRTAWQRYRLGLGALAVVLAGYLLWHRHLGAELRWPAADVWWDLAEPLIGTAFTTGVLGGPWRWAATAPPASFADPPATLVHLSWVVLTLVLLHTVLRRHGAARSWGLLAGYLLLSLWLAAATLPDPSNAFVALDLRLLTTVGDVAVLCLGLALLPVEGAEENSHPRSVVLLARPAPPLLVNALVLAVLASGVFSTLRHVQPWHDAQDGRAWFDHVRTDLAERGRTDLADGVAPAPVISSLAAPTNTTRVLAPLASPLARFPQQTSDLHVIDASGRVRPALIATGVTSPPGPVPECGWRIVGATGEVPLQGPVLPGLWWVRIGYLASASSPVTVRAGAGDVDSSVESGLHSLFLELDGPFDSVRVDGLAPGAVLCVDTIEVGFAVPGGSNP